MLVLKNKLNNKPCCFFKFVGSKWRFIFLSFFVCLLQYFGCRDFYHTPVTMFTNLPVLLFFTKLLSSFFCLPSPPPKSSSQPYLLFLVLLSLFTLQPIQLFSYQTVHHYLSTQLSWDKFHPIFYANSWLLKFNIYCHWSLFYSLSLLLCFMFSSKI